MSNSYSPLKSRNLYDPDPTKPYRISRSGLDQFLNCQRCFYLDRKLGLRQPPGYPFNLNSAVDTLLKKEFDTHRAAATVHPLCVDNGLQLVPFRHELMDDWRNSLSKGITYLVPGTNILLTGGVDDVWTDPATGELVIVDYKATSKNGEVSLDAEWQIGYRRQMEIYQWLFRRNGFTVSSTGYFVYCNGRTDGDGFYSRLDFDIKLLPYQGDDTWVEGAVRAAHALLNTEIIPEKGEDCDLCAYYEARTEIEKNKETASPTKASA